jgi:hypothetical protein
MLGAHLCAYSYVRSCVQEEDDDEAPTTLEKLEEDRKRKAAQWFQEQVRRNLRMSMWMFVT